MRVLSSSKRHWVAKNNGQVKKISKIAHQCARICNEPCGGHTHRRGGGLAKNIVLFRAAKMGQKCGTERNGE